MNWSTASKPCFAGGVILVLLYVYLLWQIPNPAAFVGVHWPQQPQDQTSKLADQTDLVVSSACSSHRFNRSFCLMKGDQLPPTVLSLTDNASSVLQQLRDSVILVVLFNNNKTYYVSPLIHSLYARAFKAVRYCGPSTSPRSFSKSIFRYFPSSDMARMFETVYLSYEKHKPAKINVGETCYICVNLALESVGWQADISRPNEIRGVLAMQDDVFFNYFQVAFNNDAKLTGEFNLDKSYYLRRMAVPWDVDKGNTCKDKNCNNSNVWKWFNKYRNQTLTFYNKLYDIYKSGSANETLGRCARNLAINTKGYRRVLYGMVDIFYISHAHLSTATSFFDLAERTGSYQEIAIATLLACLDPKATGQIDSKRTIANRKDRKPAFLMYSADSLAIHPFKLSQIVRGAASRDKSDIDLPTMRQFCLYCSIAQYSKMLNLLLDDASKKAKLASN